MISSLYSMSGYCCGHGAGGREEKPVRQLHDVGFVNGVNLFAPVLARIFECELRNARRSALGNDFQALDDARHHGVLEPRIQILGVFADDDQVHSLKARLHAFEVFHRPQIRIQIERLPQPHVDAWSAARNRRRHRPFQRHAVLANRIEHARLQERHAAPLDLRARRDLVPINRHARCREDFLHRLRYFRSDPVTGNECDVVCHVSEAF